MNLLISDTFTDSLARLTADEQKAAKTTVFDMHVDPKNPGLSFHKLDKARDKRFWSVRVGRDIRLIVHRDDDSILLCYVDHHDKAYDWAERRKIETHPTTGAAQIVEIRERVQEVVVPIYVEEARPAAPKPPLFAQQSDEALLAFGVPPEWISDVRSANDDSLLVLAGHLPAEAAEALLELATGGTPRPQRPAPPAADPFEHPDAQRRFRVMSDVEELTRALEYPWERWTVFLHPAQRELVERRHSGPARVAGSAGTGKTIVAIHRAAYLARAHPGARVLLTTFSEALAGALRIQLGRLIGTEPRLRERIDVEALDVVAARLGHRLLGTVKIAGADVAHDLIREHAGAAGDHKYSPQFLQSEWGEVVDAWQLSTWEAYRDVQRLGRKTRLNEARRQQLWAIFDRVRGALHGRLEVTQAGLYTQVAARLGTENRGPYDFIVVDEAQDLSVPQLRFLAALGGGRSDALFFTGDLGQRIFQTPFSWRSLGVDVRGRSGTLRINYRTSHQIRSQADRLLDGSVRDVDGAVEDRGGATSVFNGPPPRIHDFDTSELEAKGVGEWIAGRHAEGVRPHEMAVFVRSMAELPRARAAVVAAGMKASVLDATLKSEHDHVVVATMHLAKGLEYRAVAVMACDDVVVPLQERIAAVADTSDLEDVYATERHLLYVACTRARDHLLVSGVSPTSEFLADLLTPAAR